MRNFRSASRPVRLIAIWCSTTFAVSLVSVCPDEVDKVVVRSVSRTNRTSPLLTLTPSVTRRSAIRPATAAVRLIPPPCGTRRPETWAFFTYEPTQPYTTKPVAKSKAIAAPSHMGMDCDRCTAPNRLPCWASTTSSRNRLLINHRQASQQSVHQILHSAAPKINLSTGHLDSSMAFCIDHIPMSTYDAYRMDQKPRFPVFPQYIFASVLSWFSWSSATHTCVRVLAKCHDG